MYLATFANYDGKLIDNRGNSIKRSALPKVLGINKSVVTQFIKQVTPAYLSIDSNGDLIMNSNAIFKGALPDGNDEDISTYQRLFITGMRKLYETVTARQHKTLGYVFKLLPYINIQNNVICSNIFEEDIDKVDFITLEDFCRLIGYDYSNIQRLLKVYNSITFEVKNKGGKGVHPERFLSFVYDGTDRGKAMIFINPRVLYAGKDYASVEKLGAFCRIDKNTSSF